MSVLHYLKHFCLDTVSSQEMQQGATQEMVKKAKAYIQALD